MVLTPEVLGALELLVRGVGVGLFLGGALTLLAHLAIDVRVALKTVQEGRPGRPAIAGFPELLSKLPERYLAPLIVLLVGLFLFNPETFGKFTEIAFPPAEPTGSASPSPS